MQTFFSKYGLAAHLALLSVAPLFLFPFCQESTVATTLLWMSLSALAWMLLEPSRRSDEMLHNARERVFRSLVTDPLFWILLVLIVFTGLRALNGGIAVEFNPAVGRWVVGAPSASLLPGHAGDTGYLPFATMVAVSVLIEGCRLSLGKSARIAFIGVGSIAAGVGAIAAAIACGSDNAEALAVAGFKAGEWIAPSASDPRFVSSPGFAYGLWFLASLVASVGLFECKWNKILLLFSFAIGGTATGLFYFSLPHEFAVTAIVGLVCVIAFSVYAWMVLHRIDVFKFIVMVLVASLIPVLVGICIVPNEMTAAHGGVFMDFEKLPASLFPDGFWQRRFDLSAYAMKFWKDEAWLGCGLGVFPLRLWVDGAAIKHLVSDGALNGWWLLLAERGIIGLLSFAIPLAFMLYSTVRRAIGAIRRHIFWPLVALGVLSIFAAAASAFFSSSFLRADAILPIGAFFALAGGSFPLKQIRISKTGQDT